MIIASGNILISNSSLRAITTIKRKKDKFQDVLPTQDVLPY